MTNEELLNEVAASPRSEPDPRTFFGTEGLLVQTLAQEIRRRVTVGRLTMQRDNDADDALWHCVDGLWCRGAVRHVERACGQLLGERLRGSYVSNVLLALRTGDLPVIPDGPPHPELINFRNGTLEWSTLSFTPGHDCGLRSTVQLNTHWDEDAECPTYDAWVREMLPVDAVEYIDEVTGYLMYNGNPLHKAILLYGTGRNGKGTYLRIHGSLLGRANYAAVPLQTLCENRFATAELHMKLANIAGDIDSRHIEQTNVFKMLTGNDPTYAERKNGQPFHFTSWAVPVFSANQIPTSSDTSVGYMNRWEVIPFLVDLMKLPGGPSDEKERYIIANEIPGIARRGVLGLQRLLKRGHFERPPSVAEAYRNFEQRVDPVRAWIEERCDLAEPAAWTYRTELHTDHTHWANENNHKSMSAGKFFEKLEAAGYRPRKRDNQRGFAGIRLLTPTPTPAPVSVSAAYASFGHDD